MLSSDHWRIGVRHSVIFPARLVGDGQPASALLAKKVVVTAVRILEMPSIPPTSLRDRPAVIPDHHCQPFSLYPVISGWAGRSEAAPPKPPDRRTRHPKNTLSIKGFRPSLPEKKPPDITSGDDTNTTVVQEMKCKKTSYKFAHSV